MIKIENGYVSVEVYPHSSEGKHVPGLADAMVDDNYSVPLTEGGKAYFVRERQENAPSRFFVQFPPNHFKPEELLDEGGLIRAAQDILSSVIDTLLALRAQMRILDKFYGSSATK